MSRIVALVVAALALVWAAGGVVLVDSGEVAVVFRLGAVDRTVGSGFHLRLPWPLEQHRTVNVSEVKRAAADTQRMLTGDTNLIDLGLVTQYTVSDAVLYVVDVEEPDRIVRDVVMSVATEVVATIDVDTLLTIGRSALQRKVIEQSQAELDALGTGIRIDAIEVAELTPPPDVVDAFNDVSSARGDRETLALAAEAYSSDVLPKARGRSSERVEKARGQATTILAIAQGDIKHFEAVRDVHRQAPAATRTHLRSDALERVGSRVSVLAATESTELDWSSAVSE